MSEYTLFEYDDGGREEAGFKGEAGDCVTRAISIATGAPYVEVRLSLMDRTSVWRNKRRSAAAKSTRGNSVRNGTRKEAYHPYLESIGWEWVPTMGIGTGCQTHLRPDELPAGRIIVRLSKHLAAVIDGVIRDTEDCSRGGTRCVYGYYRQKQTT